MQASRCRRGAVALSRVSSLAPWCVLTSLSQSQRDGSSAGKRSRLMEEIAALTDFGRDRAGEDVEDDVYDDGTSAAHAVRTPWGDEGVCPDLGLRGTETPGAVCTFLSREKQ
jgi:hypothetical protein